jgi:hypothetical protein
MATIATVAAARKCLLHEVERIIGARSKSPGQAVQSVAMRIEQGGQPVGRVAPYGDWKRIGHWLSVQISLNGGPPNVVGVIHSPQRDLRTLAARRRI